MSDDPLAIPPNVIRDDLMEILLISNLRETEAKIADMKIENESLQKSLNDESRQLLQLQAQSERLQADVRSLGFELEGVLPNLIRLEQQRLQLEIDLAGKEARYRAALVQAEELKAEKAAATRDDAILRRLEALLQLEQKEQDRLKELFTAGVVSDNEISKSVAKVAETEIRIAERQEELKASSTDARVPGLQTELFQLSLDIAEMEARRNRITEQLQGLKDARERSSDNLDELQSMREALMPRIVDLRFRIQDMGRATSLLEIRRDRLTVRLEELKKDKEPPADTADDDNDPSADEPDRLP